MCCTKVLRSFSLKMAFDKETKIFSAPENQKFYEPNESLGEFLLENLRKNPLNVVQTNHDDGISLTAGEMAKLGCRIAVNLLKHLHPGDVIGLHVSNSTHVAPLALGCFLAGLPISTTDPSFDSKDIAHIYSQTQPKIVFCDFNTLSEVEAALSRYENDCQVMTVDEERADIQHISELFELGFDDDEAFV